MRSKMKKTTVIMIMTVLALFLTLVPCLDADEPVVVVDQSQEIWGGGGWYVYSQRYFAQTFTCGISGQLSHVDILFDTWIGLPDYPSTFSIVNVVDGIPNGSIIGSVYTSGFNLGWNTIDFLPEGVFLNKDTQYAILITNDDPDCEISPSLGLGFDYENNYSGGMMWWYSVPSGSWSNEFSEALPGETDGVFVTWMVLPIPGPVSIDIKPGSCPNPLNVKDKGFISVAIVGTDDLDVTEIDPASITLAGISPVRWAYDDVTQPDGDNEDCYTCFDATDPANFNCDLDGEGTNDSYCGDGYMDLVLKFDIQTLAFAIGPVSRDQCIPLDLMGNMMPEVGGATIEGSDSVVIKTK